MNVIEKIKLNIKELNQAVESDARETTVHEELNEWFNNLSYNTKKEIFENEEW